jgi:hypothetical protein
MSELTPCPECQRHVRKSETRCPFCDTALSLAHLPPHVLPRSRLGRAATFAFGAGVVGATALVSCGGDTDVGTAVYGAPPSAGAGGSFGGSAVYGAPPSGSSSGGNTFTEGGQAVYGAPAAGAGNEEVGGAPAVGGAGADGGTPSGDGGGLAIYGGPPSGSGGV